MYAVLYANYISICINAHTFYNHDIFNVVLSAMLILYWIITYIYPNLNVYETWENVLCVVYCIHAIITLVLYTLLATLNILTHLFGIISSSAKNQLATKLPVNFTCILLSTHLSMLHAYLVTILLTRLYIYMYIYVLELI